MLPWTERRQTWPYCRCFSQRYKQDIKPLAAASETLYALKPASFRLKKEYDAAQALGFGLIAEEVEKVDAALVDRNKRPGRKRALRNGQRDVA